MKYLLKFESKGGTVDLIEYIKYCFMDILESDVFNVESVIHSSGGVFQIKIEIPHKHTGGNPFIGTYDTDLDELKRNNKLLSELYQDIETGLKRLYNEYPRMENVISTNKVGTIYLKFYYIYKSVKYKTSNK
jgi:hypothetical protein